MQHRRPNSLYITAALLTALLAPSATTHAASVTGQLKQWHRAIVTFEGPDTSEDAAKNPFTDYILSVTFTKADKKLVVPGFYAADGNAGQTSATSGNKWQVHFTPPETGKWSYKASFRTGPNIALSLDPKAGKPTAFDGDTGTLQIALSDKQYPDFRYRGALRYVGKRYLQFAQTGGSFLKAGADSPENFLAYADFDGTYDSAELKRSGEAAGGKFIHHYEPHLKDYKTGDPTWKDGKGKAIIGALNYLASKRMNSVYFITYNIDGGDGKDVWPWTSHTERMRFDCSKLDQWEIVFSHMDKLGIMMHVILQETENDQGLDKGDLGPQRKLYFRELIARFSHHPALVFNLGEENTNTDAQRKDFCNYFANLDAYNHPIVCHTFPGQYDKAYTPLLGFENFEGPSLQTTDTHNQTIKWIDASTKAGRPWIVCLDEVAVAHTGVKPDKDDPDHDEVRSKHLWGNLMAGGAGVEWYFGYKFAHNDLNCEDWRSRDRMWDLTNHAVHFFNNHLPYGEMTHADQLTSAKDDYCFAKPGHIYAIYLPPGTTTDLDLGQNTAQFTVKWYNPRTAGATQVGSKSQISGPGAVSIGKPPEDHDSDWVALISLKK